ncbi:MAG: type 4 pilus major pilin [Albidovulum sp.]|nr:type 4 pilus major pilin [Albidovulum sp.]
MTHTNQFPGPSIFTDNRERGATLIEAVLFSVIALGLVIGGIVFFEQASLSSRTNEAIRLMASLPSQIRALYQSQSSFGTDDIGGLLISSKAVPVSMLEDTDSDSDFDEINNMFGGTVTATGAGSQFTIELSNVPVEVCSRMAPFDSSGSGTIGTGIASISDGTDTDADGLSSVEAAAFCDNNASGGEVTLTWTFDR